MPPVRERTIAFIEESYDGRNYYPVRLNADLNRCRIPAFGPKTGGSICTERFIASSDTRLVV